MDQAKSALASTPFIYNIYISTQHGRVRRGREIMKVIMFRMKGIFSNSPKKKDQPSSKSQVKKRKKEKQIFRTRA